MLRRGEGFLKMLMVLIPGLGHSIQGGRKTLLMSRF